MLITSYSHKVEAGIDEAGRGSLAGPVVAAAVILPAGYGHIYLNDSKKLTARQRETVAIDIKSKALAYAVGEVDHLKIDEINILNATFLAMNKAVKKLRIAPEFLIIDGNRFKNETHIDCQCIVKGDMFYCSIAAASILAKTYRDNLMVKLSEEYPQYHWFKNKGYPTPEHRKALKEYGLSPYHRRSFHLLDRDEQLNINFT